MFLCKTCHVTPMASFCATMFDIGRADSYGRCENCGAAGACMDCKCPARPDRTIELPDEPGCNDCDGFVFVYDTCKSCGLRGRQERCPRCGGTHDRLDSREKCDPAPPHDHARRDIFDYSDTCARCQQERAFSDIILAEVQELDKKKKAESVYQPNWMRCSACGKTGNHEHPAAPQRPMLMGDMVDNFKLSAHEPGQPLDPDTAALFVSLGEFCGPPDGFAFLPHHVQDAIADADERRASPTGRLQRDFLDETIDLVQQRRRKMLLTEYDFGTVEMRIVAKLCGLTDADLDRLGEKFLEDFPGIKRFANVYVVHGDLHFDVETEPVDGEHEPGNPNCICLGLSCRDNKGADNG